MSDMNFSGLMDLAQFAQQHAYGLETGIVICVPVPDWRTGQAIQMGKAQILTGEFCRNTTDKARHVFIQSRLRNAYIDAHELALKIPSFNNTNGRGEEQP